MGQISLKPTQLSDLEILFNFQLDEDAQYLAAFMPSNAADKQAFLEKYAKLILDDTVNNQTVWLDSVIVGSIAKFEIDGIAEITYWIDKRYWKMGIASTALSLFLKLEPTRPLIGRVVFDNYASQKLLLNNGFVKTGTDAGYTNARNAIVEEYIYQLLN